MKAFEQFCVFHKITLIELFTIQSIAARPSRWLYLWTARQNDVLLVRRSKLSGEPRTQKSVINDCFVIEKCFASSLFTCRCFMRERSKFHSADITRFSVMTPTAVARWCCVWQEIKWKWRAIEGWWQFVLERCLIRQALIIPLLPPAVMAAALIDDD